jgi:exopolysaccharide biosynthesis polyprenyl glycosylphosphotransferase
MLRRFSINFAVFSIFIDMLIVIGSLLLSTIVREWMNAFPFIKGLPSSIGLPIQLFILFPVFSVLVLLAFNLYDGKKYLRIVDEFGALTLSWFFLSISLAGILYFSFRDVSRAQYLIFIVLVYIGFLIWRAFVRLYFRLRYAQLNGDSRRVLIVGSGPLGKRVEEEMSKQSVEDLRLVGYLDSKKFPDTDSELFFMGFENIVSVVNDKRITDVVIALPYSEYNNMGSIVTSLEDLPIKVWVALGFFDLALYRMGVVSVAGIPMVDLRAPALNEYQMLTKRVFDLVVGTISLVIASPLLLIASILIFLEDRGEVIYRQKRVGENGRDFTVYKFRTMIKNAEQNKSNIERLDENGNILYKFKDDPRITQIGKILRRTSVDELPQLINVLKGDMSIVGPRPELPFLVERYQPWQRKRFSVPPGITGWWQVIGRSDRPMHLHTEDDLYYIQNYSIWLDIEILIRTLWVVVMGKGSY